MIKNKRNIRWYLLGLLIGIIIDMLFIFPHPAVESEEQQQPQGEVIEEVVDKVYEDEHMRVEVKLPLDIDFCYKPAQTDRNGYFYDVWFSRDGEKIDYSADVKVTYKSDVGKAVVIKDDKVTDVTDYSIDKPITSVWFKVG